jgi:HlyD family secretion protein
VREARRLQKLQKYNQVVSEKLVDDAHTEALATKAACKAAQAAIKVSKASLKVAKAALERSLVRAPFDGTVAKVNVELGEFVTPSPPGIATPPAIDLIDTACLYISAPIDEVDAPLIKLGMKACVSLDAFAGKRCSGKVSRIAPYVLEKEKQARTVEVEVQLTDSKEMEGLLPGYSADIEVLVEHKSDTLRIPTETVMEGNRVLVLQDGKLHERRFQPGLSNWAYTEVLSGLASGDQVVRSLGRDGVEAGAQAQAE